uniref:Ig-like domain-containing protein n=1 Tax=Castor canadensis TaxID=51338 RepID=A0A8C0X086_CASCN
MVPSPLWARFLQCKGRADMVLSSGANQSGQCRSPPSHDTSCVPVPLTSPTIFPLSLAKAEIDNEVIVGCLIRDFFPSGPVNVTWSKSGDPVVLRNFPPVLATEGLYIMSSQLTLPADQCPDDTSLTCYVQHDSSPTQDVAVPCKVPEPLPCPKCHPSLSLQRPSLEDLLLGSDASLTCTLRGLKKPEGATFTWQPSGGKDAIQKHPEPDSCGCFSVSSVLPGCAEPWNSGETFTCTVSHPELEEPKTATIAKATENTFRPQVHLLPPPPEELPLNELVSLTCLVRGFNPPEVLVRWLQGTEKVPPNDYVVWGPLREPNEGAITYVATSILRVKTADWKKGENFSCIVIHETLPTGLIQKTIDRHSGKPNNLNVSVILSEADGTCY